MHREEEEREAIEPPPVVIPRPLARRRFRLRRPNRRTVGTALLCTIGLAPAVTIISIALRMGYDSDLDRWDARLPELERRALARGWPMRESDLPAVDAGGATAMRQVGKAGKAITNAEKITPQEIALARRAADGLLPHTSMQFARKWSDGYGIGLSDLYERKKAVRAIALGAERAARAGDRQELVADLRRIDRIATLTGGETGASAVLVCGAMHSIGDKARVDAVRVRRDLAPIVAAVPRSPFPTAEPAVRDNVWHLIHLTSSAEQFNKIFEDPQAAAFNRGKRAMPSLWGVNDAQRLRAYRAAGLARLFGEPIAPGISGELTSFLGSDELTTRRFLRKLDAQRKMTDGFFATLAGRPMPIDPFTGRPFVRHPVPGGFILWSPGADGKGRPDRPTDDDLAIGYPTPVKVIPSKAYLDRLSENP